MSSATTHLIDQYVGGALAFVLYIIYDFQTLRTGMFAIGAAYYAGAPVWRQLKNSNLQTRILHRETLASLMREAQERYARVSKDIGQPLADLSQLTSDYNGDPVEIGEHDAHGSEQRIQGTLDWYLLVLKDTETDKIEHAKSKFKENLDDLAHTLNDVHWPTHNDQHDEDRSFSDEKWAEILKRSKDSKLLAHDKVQRALSAFIGLREAHAERIEALRRKIAELDRGIAGNG